MHELNEHKHLKGKPVGEVVSGGVGFGPRTPGNEDAISLYAEIERELSIWLRGWKPNRHGVQDQLGWIAFNADWVSQQPDSDGLLTELHRWAGLVERAVGRGPTIKDLAALERRQSAASIRRRLASKGHRVTTDTIRGWARHGHITTKPLPNGHSGYLMTEVLDHLGKGAP
ncbi:hypothetical protein ACXM2N_03430 [Corynebacterium sp. ZY180755]